MDFQKRKLKLIEYLSHVEDEHLLKEIESVFLRKNVEKEMGEGSFEPFTQEEMEARIKISMDDFENGRFYTQEEVEKLSENW